MAPECARLVRNTAAAVVTDGAIAPPNPHGWGVPAVMRSRSVVAPVSAFGRAVAEVDDEFSLSSGVVAHG
jgi:hypothetical protein